MRLACVRQRSYTTRHSNILIGATTVVGVVAKGFLWMVFCHTLFCRVLCFSFGEMDEDEHLNFKNRHCAFVASAIPQPHIKKKNP